MKLSNKVLAIIWDFDGTIANTWNKNYNVTKNIIRSILKTDHNAFPVLDSVETYHSAHTKAVNWREFYKDSFRMSESQVDEAGRLWTEYQLKDQTPVELINGVEDTISSLKNFPHGIVSQNSREGIIRYLKQKNILNYFQTVVGYEEVHITRQKPHPDGLLTCVERLVDSESGYVFFIGDHETDAQCVKNANEVLIDNKSEIKILSIGAFYGFNVDTTNWNLLPDYEAKYAGEIKSIVEKFIAAND